MCENNKHTAINRYWKKFFDNENECDTFSSIYNYYVHDLLYYGISLGFQEDICRDAVHDVFCKILVDKNKFAKATNLTAYLFTATKNRLLNIQNKNSRLTDFNSEDLPFSVEISAMESLIDQEDTLKLKATVEKLLNELTPRQRESVYMRFMQGLSYEEIASYLEINSNSARRLVHRSIEHLRHLDNVPDNILFTFIVPFYYYLLRNPLL